MADLAELNAALLKADAAGDTASAQLFANQIKQLNAAEAPPQQSEEDIAHAQGVSSGEQESPVGAFMGQGARNATFGLSNYISAGTRYAAQRLKGDPNAESYAANLAFERGKSEGEIGQHPTAGTIGGVLGGLTGGGIVGKGLQAAKKIPGIAGLVATVLPKEGQPVANVAKAAAMGAAIGAGTSATEGKNAPEIARDAAIDAVVGPIISKGITATINWADPYVTSVIAKLVPSFSANGLAGASKQAFKTLADTLDMTAQELQSAYDAHIKLTGALPSMAQLTTLKAQGKLHALAGANPEIGEAAMTAAQAGNAPLHVQLQQAAQDRAALAAMPTAAVGDPTLRANLQGVNAGQTPQTSQSLLSARDTAMTQLMDAPSAAGLKLRDEPVSNHTGIFNDPHVEYALTPETRSAGRLGKTNPVLDAIQNNRPLTLGQVEEVRKALRDQQSLWSRPSPGTDRAANPRIAAEFGDIANKIEGEATSQYPDYGKALRGFRQVSRYDTGFNHGFNGKALSDAPDNFTAKDLLSPMGQAGYAHGNALKRAQSALDAISPGSVPEAQIPTAATAIKAVKAAKLPTISTLAQLQNHLSGLSLQKNVQQVVAKQLFSNDPVVVRQGIANLARAKVSADNIRTLGAAIGGSADVLVAQYLNGK
jgi:hypothetical protein